MLNEDKNKQNPTHAGWERCSIVLARRHCAWEQAPAHGNNPLRFCSKTQPSWWKTPRFALKNLFGRDSAYGFYCFASDDVFSCETTSDEGMDCAGACSLAQSHDISTQAQSAKTSAEGFSRFLLLWTSKETKETKCIFSAFRVFRC